MRINGTAGADRFKKAWLELGEGESPSKWKKVAKGLKAASATQTLAEVDAKHFKGAPKWTLRLLVQHADGRVREARYVLKLGG